MIRCSIAGLTIPSRLNCVTFEEASNAFLLGTFNGLCHDASDSVKNSLQQQFDLEAFLDRMHHGTHSIVISFHNNNNSSSSRSSTTTLIFPYNTLQYDKTPATCNIAIRGGVIIP